LNCWRLVAETNAKGTRYANEISPGTHGFEFASGIANFDGADLRPSERDHLPEVAAGVSPTA
jgi:hypothetical protein